MMVYLGLLPGIDGDHSKQTVALTNNIGGSYRVAPVLHHLESSHFAFEGIEFISLWCRHGEGNLQFYSDFGMVSKEEGEMNRKKVNEQGHVLLRYVDAVTKKAAYDMPDNPNGSVDGIAGLVNKPNGTIIGHMAHTEVSVYLSRDPDWNYIKDSYRRNKIKAADLKGKQMESEGLQVFRNIVNYFK